ncbi:MAG: sugar ABC transporter substrate-binding protein, partial [Candidatus Microbacterium stercoravium]
MIITTATKRTRRWRTLGAAALAGSLAISLAGCGSSDGGAEGSPEIADMPAEGVDDGTTITMWSRAPLEKQAQ